MVAREHHIRTIEVLLSESPAVALLGARQVGKTTLSRRIEERWSGAVTRFDLEDPDDLARLAEPKLALGALDGLVVLDEVQRSPDLFPILRVLIDRPDHDTRFLILGSASPDLLRQSSESLAGRIAFHELPGLSVDETGLQDHQRLWIRGGFPPSFLAPTDEASGRWLRDFTQTFLERDLAQLGIGTASRTMHRFWRMLAHRHGQLWNASSLAQSFGVSAPTVRNYLDQLTGTFVVHQLPAWHENLSKRQVRSPKVYVADTGVLHSLLGLETLHDVQGHPVCGASWEGFVAHETIRHMGARRGESYFWATHAGAELDLLIVRGRTRIGFEIKRTTSPRTTKSMHSARESLRLDQLHVVHAGTESFPLAEGIKAIAFPRLFEDVEPLSSKD